MNLDPNMKLLLFIEHTLWNWCERFTDWLVRMKVKRKAAHVRLKEITLCCRYSSTYTYSERVQALTHILNLHKHKNKLGTN